MAQLSAADMRFLDVTLQMTGGYCLDFSDRTFSGFFADAIGYDIDAEHNHAEGGSKGSECATSFARPTTALPPGC